MVDERHEFSRLFTLYGWVTIAVVALVLGFVLLALVRYRSRNGRRASRRAEAKLLEGLFAALLLAVAIVLIAFTLTSESRVDHVASHPDLRVEVVGFDWGWRFRYSDLGISVVTSDAGEPTLVVPAHQVVQFTTRSRDVIHSFFIPGERFKRDAFPDRPSRFDLVFGRVGTLTGRCAEFCGLRHDDMGFRVRVVPPGAFRAWAAAQGTEGGA